MKLCECGCKLKTKNQNRFIYGHNRRKALVIPEKIKLCKCGCGTLIIEKNEYEIGHNRRNQVTKNETKLKLHNANKNQKPTEEQRLSTSKTIKEMWKDPNSIYNSVKYQENHRKISSRQEVKNKIKETMISKGRWTKDEELSNLQLYNKLVWRYTGISARKKYSKEELKQRGMKKELGHKNLDHIFSIHEGFKFGILPMIMGSACNIKLVDCLYNKSKHSRCDISKEELFQRYYEDK